MYDLTASCRNKNCDNYLKSFVKREKKATYIDGNDRVQRRTDLTCPLCRTWGKILEIREVA
jgi:hypothetical protein